MSDDRTVALITSGIAVGMLLPIVAALAFHEVLSLYLTGRTFTYVVGTAFALVAWACVTALDLDHVDAAVWSVILPWIVVFGPHMLLLSAGPPDGLTYLFYDVGDLGRYAGAYMVAGLAAVAGARAVERLSERAAWLPAPRSIALGVTLVAGLGVPVFVGSLHISASSATVADVQPGISAYYDSSLNVTIEGEAEELRLHVTSPDGETYVTRVTGSDGRAATTVPVEFRHLGRQPTAGRYRVELRSVLGVTVDSASYTLETPPSPAIVAVETAGPGEELELDTSPVSSEFRPSAGTTHPATRVAVVFENRGDVGALFRSRLVIDGEPTRGRDVFAGPGGRAANVVALSDEGAERIHEELDGTLTVEVRYRDDVVTREVRLPVEDLPE
ncbi:MAG: hypothetical protein V5A52_06780 [Halovenus sp.]